MYQKSTLHTKRSRNQNCIQRGTYTRDHYCIQNGWCTKIQHDELHTQWFMYQNGYMYKHCYPEGTTEENLLHTEMKKGIIKSYVPEGFKTDNTLKTSSLRIKWHHEYNLVPQIQCISWKMIISRIYHPKKNNRIIKQIHWRYLVILVPQRHHYSQTQCCGSSINTRYFRLILCFIKYVHLHEVVMVDLLKTSSFFCYKIIYEILNRETKHFL